MSLSEIMPLLRSRWGLLRFLTMVVPAGILYSMVADNAALYTYLLNADGMVIFLLASLTLLLLTAYSSYSRIYKFRVLLAGHLFAGTALFYIFLTRFAFVSTDSPLGLDHLPPQFLQVALRLLLIFSSFNGLATVLAPITLRHRKTKYSALILTLTEMAALFIILKSFNPLSSLPFLEADGFFRAILLLNSATILASLLGLKEDNSFGGVIAGIALIQIFIGLGLQSPAPVEGHALWVIVPLLLTVGTVLYWFSCLHHRVAYDPLMKIYNRDYAHHIISGHADLSLGSPFVVAMIDVDHFKSVNDTYGHPAGDAVLYSTAQRIRSIVMPRGIACRYGGEEIVVFFRNTKESDAYALCETVRREVRRLRHRAGDREFAITVSIGLAECDEGKIPADRALKAADEALYQAKETGRNKVLIGRLKKRTHNPNRPTYVNMRAVGQDRRLSEETAE